AACDKCLKLVDLCARFGRGLDLDPAADAVEDRFGVEGIDVCHRRIVIVGRIRPMSCAHAGGCVNRSVRTAVRIQRWSGPSRVAICSTRSTMERRILASVMRVKARVSAKPSEVARKSET